MSDEQLQSIAISGTAEELRLFLKENPAINVNRSNKWGNAPLHLACIARKHDVVDVLLECGASVTASGVHGQTPVQLCISTETVEGSDKPTDLVLVEKLLNHHLGEQKKAEEKYLADLESWNKDHPGEDPEFEKPVDSFKMGNHIVGCAVGQGNVAVVELMLAKYENEVDFEDNDEYGLNMPILHFAATHDAGNCVFYSSLFRC
jgi:hypothetical protein